MAPNQENGGVIIPSGKFEDPGNSVVEALERHNTSLENELKAQNELFESFREELALQKKANIELRQRLAALNEAVRNEDYGPEFNKMVREKMSAGLSREQAVECARNQIASNIQEREVAEKAKPATPC